MKMQRAPFDDGIVDLGPAPTNLPLNNNFMNAHASLTGPLASGFQGKPGIPDPAQLAQLEREDYVGDLKMMEYLRNSGDIS